MQKIPLERANEMYDDAKKFLEELIEQHQIKLAIPNDADTAWLATQIEGIAKDMEKKWWILGFLSAMSIRNRLHGIMKVKKE